MHNREGWFHIELLQSSNFASPLPVFAHNIFPEELYSSRIHFFGLNEMGITIYFTLVHVYCPLRKSMTTSCNFKASLIKLCLLSCCILCCSPMWLTTHAVFVTLCWPWYLGIHNFNMRIDISLGCYKGVTIVTWSSLSPLSSPEPLIHLGCAKDQDLWLPPTSGSLWFIGSLSNLTNPSFWLWKISQGFQEWYFWSTRYSLLKEIPLSKENSGQINMWSPLDFLASIQLQSFSPKTMNLFCNHNHCRW